jgi:hypothetical protein
MYIGRRFEKSIVTKMTLDNELVQQFGKYFCFISFTIDLHVFFYLLICYFLGKPAASGLPVAGSCIELEALRRIVETSGRAASSRNTPKTGPTEPGCKSVAPPIGGLPVLANGKATTGVYKKATKGTEVLVEELDIEEDPTIPSLVRPTKMEMVLQYWYHLPNVHGHSKILMVE